MQEFPAYTLEEIERADWRKLTAILDYRKAQVAIDLFNGGRPGLEQLEKRPDLALILTEMGRAQAGPALTLDHMLAVKAAETPDDEDDD